MCKGRPHLTNEVEIQKIKDARKIQFGEFRDLLRGKIKFEIVYLPWIANTPIITVSLDSVKLLAELDQVINISLNVENSPTQGPDLDATNDILDVRQQLRTTPYDSLNLDWGFLAVIDSGIRLTHNMVDDQIVDYSGDCFNGGVTCWGDGSSPNGASGTNFPNYNIADFANNNNGHGTPIKAGISGSGDLGAELLYLRLHQPCLTLHLARRCFECCDLDLRGHAVRVDGLAQIL